MRKVLDRRMILRSLYRLNELVMRRASEEDGQALVEYSLLLGLIAVVAFGAVNEFGLGVSGLYSRIVAVYPKH
jgi:Flp pilus assembly pilin Flp